MNKDSRIYIAGHRGMVGSAILRNLKQKGYSHFILRTHQELDLTRQAAVESFFEQERPEVVFLAAAKVGGIVANNTYRADFIYQNLMIQNNVIHAAYKHGTKKLLFLGSSCIYPKNAPQPMKEEYLLTAPLEYTNEPYAIAKIAGIKMCENYYRQYGAGFISVMPTNLYGPNDNYDLQKSHVLPALIRKMYLGKCLQDNNWPAIRHDLAKNPIDGTSESSSMPDILNAIQKMGIMSEDYQQPNQKIEVALWGTGNVYRELLHVDDMGEACVYLMEKMDAKTLYSDMNQTHINIGTGEDLTIRQLAELVKEITGFRGNLLWDPSKPDGTPRKQLDVSLLRSLGWKPQISLKQGIQAVYEKYQQS